MPEDFKILVVDNEPLVRLGIVVMLREQGWRTMSAEGMKSAVEIIDQGYQPDLLITDQNMPDFEGISLGEMLIERFAELKVLIVSGDDLENVVPSGWLSLAKPFTSAELLAKISELFPD